MTDQTLSTKCQRCGAPATAAVSGDFCSACLLKQVALGTDDQSLPSERWSPPSVSELASAFPQLEILEIIGCGGMGAVYKARQKSLGRLVALKILAPKRAANSNFAERFTREAQALAELNHPNIVTVHDFGKSGEFYFLLMEYIDGVNLRQAMEAGRLAPKQALAIVPSICEALQFAHDHGIVHRDIKPENLLLDKLGRIKIADFGIARIIGGSLEPEAGFAGSESDGLTQESVLGTPPYMAPEQSEHPAQVDHRADIYSLGVVLYEMLTGELPAGKIEPPTSKVHLDVRLDAIVLRALEQTPELRYQKVSELRTQVMAVVDGPRPGTHDNQQRNSIPKVIKVSNSVATTPEQLATLYGQLFLIGFQAQSILDESQISFTHQGKTTGIPLESIYDLSIGRYPKSINLVGLDFISVSYQENHKKKQILFSPMEGYFAWPSQFNQRVAERFYLVRDAIVTATGRLPGNTPADQLGTPASFRVLLYFPFIAVIVSQLVLFTCLFWLFGRPSEPVIQAPQNISQPQIENAQPPQVQIQPGPNV